MELEALQMPSTKMRSGMDNLGSTWRYHPSITIHWNDNLTNEIGIIPRNLQENLEIKYLLQYYLWHFLMNILLLTHSQTKKKIKINIKIERKNKTSKCRHSSHIYINTTHERKMESKKKEEETLLRIKLQKIYKQLRDTPQPKCLFSTLCNQWCYRR